MRRRRGYTFYVSKEQWDILNDPYFLKRLQELKGEVSGQQYFSKKKNPNDG